MNFILWSVYAHTSVSNKYLLADNTSSPFHPYTQDDNSLLKQQLKDFQKHLNQVVDGLIHPEEVAARVDELRRKLKLGAGEMR